MKLFIDSKRNNAEFQNANIEDSKLLNFLVSPIKYHFIPPFH